MAATAPVNPPTLRNPKTAPASPPLTVSDTTVAAGGHSRIVQGCYGSTPVAVKLLKRSDPHTTREVMAMCRLGAGVHPHIVQVLPPSSIGNDMVALPMRRYDGDLFSVLAAGRLEEPVAARALSQMLSGLQHCVSRGVSHLDIKPENVLVRSNGTAGGHTLVLCDFGNAFLAPHPGALCTNSPGTPTYSAPETSVFTGAVSAYNPVAADVWSLGVTLLAMVTSSLPWESATKDDEAYAAYVECGHLPLPAGFELSPALRDLLMGMLNPDPTRRLTLEGVASHPWVTSGGQPTAAPSSAPRIELPPVGGASAMLSTTGAKTPGVTTAPTSPVGCGPVPLSRRSSAPAAAAGVSLPPSGLPCADRDAHADMAATAPRPKVPKGRAGRRFPRINLPGRMG